MTVYADTQAPRATLLRAWRHDLTLHPDQLVHAVAPGEHVAECGVEVTVFGPSWPDRGTGTLQSRCSICAQAVQGTWATEGRHSNLR